MNGISDLSNCKRIIIKIGSNLFYHDNRFDNRYLKAILKDILSLITDYKKEVIIVTSGSIAAGLSELKINERSKSISLKQAAACVGQPLIMALYRDFFKEAHLPIGQVLITQDAFQDRKRYKNAKNAFEALLKHHTIPIVNENDAVAVDEIKFGDNDTLSAHICTMLDGDLLVILTDIDGLYENYEDPENRKLLLQIDNIGSEIKNLAKSSDSRHGTGGMITKLKAAKLVTEQGIPMIISNGKREGILLESLNQSNHRSLFLPKKKLINKRKHWLLNLTKANGSVIIDDGAILALTEKGKSLLASGIVATHGTYKAYDIIYIETQKGKQIAKGIVNYSSSEISSIKGKHSETVQELLGHKKPKEVIHRDNMVFI